MDMTKDLTQGPDPRGKCWEFSEVRHTQGLAQGEPPEEMPAADNMPDAALSCNWL